MLLFSCRLPLVKEVDASLFFEEMVLYAQSSPYKENRMESISWNGKIPASFSSGHLSMEFDGLENESLYAMRFEKRKDGILWRTDVCANLDTSEIWIQLDRSYLKTPATPYAYFSTPRLISILIEDGLIAQSDPLPFLCRAHSFEGPWDELYPLLCDDDRCFSIPLVVLGVRRHEPAHIDGDALAWQLKGAAHVLVLEDELSCTARSDPCADHEWRLDSSSLSDLTSRSFEQNLCDSSIQTILIVYPDKNDEGELIYVRPDSKDWAMEEIRNRVIASQLCQEDACLPRFMMQKARNNKEAAPSCQAQLEQTEKEYLELLETLEALKNETRELREENACYRQRLAMREHTEGILLKRSSSEYDFYPDEAKDFILDAVEMALRTARTGSRRADLFEDLLACNPKSGNAERLESKIRQLHSSGLSPSRKAAELRHLGFSVEKRGGHYKATFHGDSRYLFVFSSTPGDYRAEANNLSYILQALF